MAYVPRGNQSPVVGRRRPPGHLGRFLYCWEGAGLPQTGSAGARYIRGNGNFTAHGCCQAPMITRRRQQPGKYREASSWRTLHWMPSSRSSLLHFESAGTFFYVTVLLRRLESCFACITLPHRSWGCRNKRETQLRSDSIRTMSG